VRRWGLKMRKKPPPLEGEVAREAGRRGATRQEALCPDTRRRATARVAPTARQRQIFPYTIDFNSRFTAKAASKKAKVSMQS